MRRVSEELIKCNGDKLELIVASFGTKTSPRNIVFVSPQKAECLLFGKLKIFLA